MRSLSVFILVALSGPAYAQTEQTETSSLTADVRPEQEPALDLPRLILEIPGAFIELAFVPFLPVALAFERLHLFDRIFDLLTNDDRTLAFAPIIDPVNGSGFGAGLAVVHNDPLGSQDRTVLLGLLRVNEDRVFNLSISRRLPFLSGRIVRFGAGYSVDHDQRFFGLGGKSVREDERRLRTENLNVTTGVELLSASGVGMELQLAYRRRVLANGRADGEIGIADDDRLARPPGFGVGLDYPEATLSLSYDSRDAVGRTTTGWILSVEGSATHDVNGADTGGFRATAGLGTFIEVAPLFRVLYLGVGASAAVPLRRGDEIPLHHLTTLGGSSRLRGYVNDRFQERLAWWGTAEYRYHFYMYGASGYGVSAVVFADVGRVGRDPEDLVRGPIGWSTGLGLRLEHNLLLFGRAQIAVGPEGVRLSVGFGELL